MANHHPEGRWTTNERTGEVFAFIDWHCPTCGPGAETFLGYRGGRYQAEGRGLESKIVQCDRCSLLYANPFPVAKDLSSIYGNPETYFAGHDASAKVEANRAILRKAARLTVPSPRVIDIGSGCGELLVAAREEGINAVGTEVSAAMVATAERTHGVYLTQQTIEQAAAAMPAAFDTVVLNAVLEHAYDPSLMIQSARKLLKTGGVLYVDVPHEPNILTRVAGWLNRLAGGVTAFNLSPTWEPYHVYGFNRRSLEVLLKKYHFQIEEFTVHCEMALAPRPGFRGSAQVWLANRLNDLGNLTGTSGNLSLWARAVE